MVERKRHLAKAITYRLFGSAVTAGIAYIVTGHAGIGAMVGVADSVVKIGGYYVHERIWYRIRWGIRPAAESAAPAVETVETTAPRTGAEVTIRSGVRVARPVAAD